MKELFIVFCFIALVSAMVLSGSPSIKDPETCTDQSTFHDTLEGCWNADFGYTQAGRDLNASKNISFRWFESIIFRKDTFMIEEHKWFPPRNTTDGTEYLPFEGKSYYSGSFITHNDTLILYGYHTTEAYKKIVYENSEIKYQASFLYTIKSDTLELFDFAVSKKYRLIKKIK